MKLRYRAFCLFRASRANVNLGTFERELLSDIVAETGRRTARNKYCRSGFYLAKMNQQFYLAPVTRATFPVKSGISFRSHSYKKWTQG